MKHVSKLLELVWLNSHCIQFRTPGKKCMTSLVSAGDNGKEARAAMSAEAQSTPVDAVLPPFDVQLVPEYDGTTNVVEW